MKLQVVKIVRTPVHYALTKRKLHILDDAGVYLWSQLFKKHGLKGTYADRRRFYEQVKAEAKLRTMVHARPLQYTMRLVESYPLILSAALSRIVIGLDAASIQRFGCGGAIVKRIRLGVGMSQLLEKRVTSGGFASSYDANHRNHSRTA